MANPQVVVDFVANTKGLQKGVSESSSATSGFASKLKSIGKAGALAAGAAGVGALVATIKIGIDEYTEAAKVSAQTNAVLKSTGEVAGVSADHVSDLAGAIMEKSGIDDEAIQSGENLLLTFTNIRNEAGKGNDIFDQTVGIMADMSAALGQDTKTSAIQLGKALNDPVKGITALSRVGVSFTEGQKKTIKSLVAHGKTLEAQKVILKELNKEFGGSAEALGKTLPGQINIAKQTFSNFAGELVAKLVPAIQQSVAWLRDHWPEISKAIKDAWDQQIKPTLTALADIFVAVAGLIKDNWGTIGPIVMGAVKVLKDAVAIIVDVLKIVGDIIRGDWSQAWKDLKQVAIDAVKLVVDYLKLAVTEYGTIARLLGRAIVAGITAALSGLGALVNAGVAAGLSGIKAIVTAAADAAKNALSAAWNALTGVARTAWNAVVTTVTNVLDSLKSTVTGLGSSIVNGLASGVRSAINAVTSAITAVKNAIVNAFSGAVDWLLAAGKAIINGLVNGVRAVINTVATTIGGVKTSVTRAITGAITWLYDVGKDVIQGFINGMESLAHAAVEKAKSIASAPVNAVKGVLGIGSPSRVFFDIGSDTVQGFVDGLNKKIPAAQKAALRMAATVVDTAGNALKRSGDQLSSYLQQAFSAQQQAMETPAQKALRVLQESHDDAARAQDLADANAQLAAATTADETLAAQRAIADATYNLKVAAMQKEADAQATALAGQQFVQKQAFDQQLAALQTYLDSANATADGARTRIKGLMDRFGIDYADVGTLLGKGFATGIRSSANDVVSATTDLVTAVKKALKRGLRIKSPSAWSRDEVGVPLVEGIVAGMGRSSGLLDHATQRMISAVRMPESAAVAQPGYGSASGAAAGAGDVHVRVFLGDQELTQLVRTEVNRSNAGIARTLIAGSV